jgi:hypothetical protein
MLQCNILLQRNIGLLTSRLQKLILHRSNDENDSFVASVLGAGSADVQVFT